jgi:hypothetical protein
LRSIPKEIFSTFFFEVKYESIPLDTIMKGIKYARKSVALPKSSPVPVATSEGVRRTGIDFLNPYFKEVKTIKKFIELPISN